MIGGTATLFFSAAGNLLAGSDGNPSVTEGGLPPQQTSLPNTYMVSTTAYNDTVAAGPIVNVVNNAGADTETQSDLLGRTTVHDPRL